MRGIQWIRRITAALDEGDQFVIRQFFRKITVDQIFAEVRQADAILGAGFRAIADDYARDSEKPWVSELQFHLLLFNVGLVGVTICLAILVTGMLFLRRASARCPELVPTLVATSTGAIAMLIANATNPYLQAPGHQWAVFFPLAVAAVMVKSADAIDTVPDPRRRDHAQVVT